MHRPSCHALRAVALAAALACGSAGLAADTLPGSPVQASGFLGDYAALAKAPGRLDTWQWVKPGVDWRAYGKIQVPPVEVWINPQAAYPGIVPEVYQHITDQFRGVLVDALRGGGYQVVDQAGAGVLRLRIALTGITPERPGLTPLDILPIKLAIDVARSATGTDKTVIAVSGEVEALDGISGERLFAQVTTRKDAHLFVGQNLSWDDVRDGATEWANQARARLDAARAGQR